MVFLVLEYLDKSQLTYFIDKIIHLIDYNFILDLNYIKFS